VVDAPTLNAYARARLADGDGALDVAVSSYRRAFAEDPGNPVVALRSYRQAIESGDMRLALGAARALDTAGVLPRDGALLLAIDALERRDWATGRSLAARMEREQNFAFLAPILVSWISLGEGDYAPPVIAEGSKTASLTRRYLDEHVALQALSLGRADAGIAAADGALSLRSGASAGFRIFVASRLAALGRNEQALVYLPPDAQSVAALRSEIARGKRIKAPALTPVQGFARLLGRLSDDVAAAGEAQGVAMTLARFATFADPQSAELQVGLARQLLAAEQPDGALREAGKVRAKSPYWLAAQDIAIEGLVDSGRQPEGMALAQTLAARPDAGAAQYQRLANIMADAGQYDAAASMFAKAADRYPAGGVPWSLYLLQGSALERAGRWDDAKRALERAAALAPNEPVVLNYLGYAQVERRQNVPAALALLKKASRLKPDDPSITDSLGWAHFIAGDIKAAVPVLERAAMGAPDDVTINEHLGDALWSVGRRFEARYAWSAASAFAEGKAMERIGGKMREGLRPEYAAP
jgi:Flp pilus assembly protein TadD